MPGNGGLSATRDRTARRAQGREQRTRAAVGVAFALRRRKMQHVRRDAREPAKAALRIEVAGNRQRARGTKFGGAFRMMRERDHAGDAARDRKSGNTRSPTSPHPTISTRGRRKVRVAIMPSIVSAACLTRSGVIVRHIHTSLEIDLWHST